jgi:hypothetical protein
MGSIHNRSRSSRRERSWFDALEHREKHPHHDLFDEYGNYRKRVVVQQSLTLSRYTGDGNLDDFIDSCILHSSGLCNENECIGIYGHEFGTSTASTIDHQPAPRVTVPHEPAYQKLRPFFGWITAEKIKKTFQHTTQLARTSTGVATIVQNKKLHTIPIRKPTKKFCAHFFDESAPKTGLST